MERVLVEERDVVALDLKVLFSCVGGGVQSLGCGWGLKEGSGGSRALGLLLISCSFCRWRMRSLRCIFWYIILLPIAMSLFIGYYTKRPISTTHPSQHLMPQTTPIPPPIPLPMPPPILIATSHPFSILNLAAFSIHIPYSFSLWIHMPYSFILWYICHKASAFGTYAIKLQPLDAYVIQL